MTYEQAQQQYKKARIINGEKRKKLSNNTYLLKDGEQYCVRLHNTIVVRIFPDNTYVLNSGGWQTRTTKERINNFSPANIYQRNKIWFFSNGEEFFDNVIITNDETVINPLPKKEKTDLHAKRKQLTKMINDYIKGFWLAAKCDLIGYPSSGDCWYCNLVTEDGQSMGDATNNHSHLIEHMKEFSFVPSLLYNAFKESHQNPDSVYQFTIETQSDWHIETTLRRYFKQRYNELLELI
jgi:hypothetical protein